MDATTLEANAALRSIVRRDTGDRYQEFFTKPAKESGIETPAREDLVRMDRKRAKKGFDQDWKHRYDPDARLAKMKEGNTHVAHKAENAVHLETGALVAVTLQQADSGDTTTMIETLITASEQVEAVIPQSEANQEVVADQGYSSTERILDREQIGLRSYISESKQ